MAIYGKNKSVEFIPFFFKYIVNLPFWIWIAVYLKTLFKKLMISKQSHGVFIGNCFVIPILNAATRNKDLAAQKEPKDIDMHVLNQSLLHNSIGDQYRIYWIIDLKLWITLWLKIRVAWKSLSLCRSIKVEDSKTDGGISFSDHNSVTATIKIRF